MKSVVMIENFVVNIQTLGLKMVIYTQCIRKFSPCSSLFLTY